MKSNIFLFVIVTLSLLTTTPVFAASIDSITNGEKNTYTRVQVDSILNAKLNLAVKEEVAKQVDENLLELKINNVANDKLCKLQATHDGWTIGIVTILVAITGIVVPLILNQNREKKIKELEEKLKDIIEIAKKSADTAKYSAKYAEFSVALTRALSNNNVSVKIGYFSNLIIEYQQYDYVSYAYNCRGTCYHEIGNYDVAIDNYTKAIEKNPGFAMAYNNRGSAYAAKNMYKNAIDDYTKAVTINPDFAMAYRSRGAAYEKIGKMNKSKADLEKAESLDQTIK